MKLSYKLLQKYTGIFPEQHFSRQVTLPESHVYVMKYCQLKLNPGKQENIQWLKSLIDL
jgi:hypothetical protein